MRFLKLLAASCLLILPSASLAQQQKDPCVIPVLWSSILQGNVMKEYKDYNIASRQMNMEIIALTQALHRSTTILGDGRNMCETLKREGIGLRLVYDYGVDSKNVYFWLVVQGYDLDSKVVGPMQASSTAVRRGTSEDALLSAFRAAAGNLQTLRLPADIDMLIGSVRGERERQKAFYAKTAE
jgi:hypothetical protein